MHCNRINIDDFACLVFRWSLARMSFYAIKRRKFVPQLSPKTSSHTGNSTTHKRVLRISARSVGSSRCSQASSLFIGPGVWPRPFSRVLVVLDFAPFLQLGGHVVTTLAHLPCRLGPAFPNSASSRRPDQGAVLDGHRSLAAQPRRVQQLLRQDQAEPIANLFNLRLHAQKLFNFASAAN